MSWMRGGLTILKHFRETLKKIFKRSSKLNLNRRFDDDHDDDTGSLPEDVKEGHFVVQTVTDGELKRFILELSYLGHPGFLKLLEEAEEEFGFEQEGVLVVPCESSELIRILENKKERRE